MQGAGGNVGKHLCKYLYEDGAIIYVNDLYEDKLKSLVKDYKATIISDYEVFTTEADVLSPAALGGIYK